MVPRCLCLLKAVIVAADCCFLDCARLPPMRATDLGNVPLTFSIEEGQKKRRPFLLCSREQL